MGTERQRVTEVERIAAVGVGITGEETVTQSQKVGLAELDAAAICAHAGRSSVIGLDLPVPCGGFLNFYGENTATRVGAGSQFSRQIGN